MGFGSGCRLLDVGYLGDDWIIVTHVWRHGALSLARAPCPDVGKGSDRPLFAGLYAADVALFGVDPFRAHAHHLSWHMLAVVLVFVLILQLGGGLTGGVLGASLFAWNSYHAVSVGWLASRGATVAATLTLLCAVCWIHHRRTGSRWASTLAWLAAPVAFLTSACGVVAFLAPPAIDLALPRRRPGSLLRDYAPFIVVAVALMWLPPHAPVRADEIDPASSASGTNEEDRASHRLDVLWGGIVRIVQGVPPDNLRDFPWLPAPWVGAALTLLLIGGAFVAQRPVNRPFFEALEKGRGRSVAVLSLLALPPFLYLGLEGEPVLDLQGAAPWYGVLAIVGAGLGVAGGASPVTRVLGAMLLFLLMAAAFEAQDRMRGVGSLSRNVLDQVYDEIHRLPEDRTPFFVSGLPSRSSGFDLFAAGFENGLAPPFRSRPLPGPVYPVHEDLALVGFGSWTAHPPVEAWLTLEGGRPVQIDVHADALAPDATIAFVMDYGDAERASVQAILDRVVAGDPLPVTPMTPTDGIPPDGRPIMLRIDTTAVAFVDLFIFIPGRDIRRRLPAAAEAIDVDLEPLFRDSAFVRGEATDVYVATLGWPTEAGTPRWGPLLHYRCLPEVPRSAWRRR
jgi:hypothetical protein